MKTSRSEVEEVLRGVAPRGKLLCVLPCDYVEAVGEWLELAERGLRTMSFVTNDRNQCNEALTDAEEIHKIFERWGKP